MADELIENAEFGRKRKNEEDPILIAQRFLNIYRQMHIFNKQKQDEFDNMLLNLSPDIRILFSTLPGGSLLLEHIEELEQKNGLISVPIKKDKSFNKKVSRQYPKAEDKSAENRGGSVIIDSSFASELSASLSLALQQTEKRYKEDIKALTETIMASQTAMAQMMKDILIASGHNMNSDNDNAVLRVLPKQPEQPEEFETEAVKEPDTMQPAEPQNQEAEEAPYVEQDSTETTALSTTDEPETTMPAEEEKLPETAAIPEEEDIIETSEISEAEFDDASGFDITEDNFEQMVEPQTPETFAEDILADDLPADLAPEIEDKPLNLGKINSLAKDLNGRLNSKKKNKHKKQFSKPEIAIDDSNNEPVNLPQEENTANIDDIFDSEDLNTEFDFSDILGDSSQSADDMLNLDLDISEKADEPESPFAKEMNQIREALIDEPVLSEADISAQPKHTETPKTSASAPKVLPELSDEVVSLDDLDIAPVSLDDIPDTSASFEEETPAQEITAAEDNASDTDWEWEYVEENGDENSEDWEWEYVDDDGTGENSDDWEWEYVDDESTDNSDTPK